MILKGSLFTGTPEGKPSTHSDLFILFKPGEGTGEVHSDLADSNKIAPAHSPGPGNGCTRPLTSAFS